VVITSSVGGLSAGAQAFIRQFQPADDDSGCIATFETVREFKPFKTQQAKAAADAAGKPFGVTDEVYEDVTISVSTSAQQPARSAPTDSG